MTYFLRDRGGDKRAPSADRVSLRINTYAHTHFSLFFPLYLSLSLSRSRALALHVKLVVYRLMHTHTCTHQLSQIPSPCPRLAHTPHRLTGLPPLGGLRSQLVCGGHLCFPLSPLALFCWIGSHVPSPPLPPHSHRGHDNSCRGR